jgi:RND superfamily putative drug exporter
MSYVSSSRAPHAGQRAGLLGGLGRACYRHRWITLFTWVIGVACLIVLWLQFGAAALNTFDSSDPGQTVLNEHFPRASGDTLTLAVKSTAPVTSPAVKARVSSALVPFERAAHVTSVSDLYTTPGQISRDGHIAFSTVQFAIAGSSISNGEATSLMNDARAASGHGVTFSLGGDVVDLQETPYGGPTDGVGVVAAAVILLIAFGSLLAMGLPVATALLGIGAGLSLIGLLGHVFPAPSFSPIIAGLIGLGVGVDYALFIVTRFRESLRAGAAPETAAVTAMRTAGRSVLVAGITVVIGMLGLLILRQSLLNGVAVAAAATVAMVLLASLTLLPALLGFSGTRLARPSRIKPPTWMRKTTIRSGKPAAERWAGVIQRHPVIAAALSGAFILVLAAPALGIKLSFPDESAQARGTMGYASYATMAQGFGPGFDAPLIIAAKLPDPHASTARLAAAVAATPGVAAVTPAVVSRDGQAAMLIAYPRTGEQDPATDTLVNRINDTALPKATAGTGITAYVTGPNAGNVSFANLIGQRLPWLIGVVVALSMLLLLVVFRSVVIAVKAAVMNLLSITAAYGALVMVSQNGWLGSLFGFPEKVPVTTWVPMFLFVILFGLSMDYEVFLLSRVREEYDSSGDNAAAVARGLSRTARVITAAAAIMVAVFLSIVIAPNVSTKQIGLGLAVAILIDATVVRLVLVPAVMELLGPANWWLPGWLDRLLPQTSLSEDEPPAGGGGLGLRRTVVPGRDWRSGGAPPGSGLPG